MIKLRKILLSNYFYICLFIIVIIYTIFQIYLPKVSIFKKDTTSFKVVLLDYNIDGNKLKLEVKNKEKLIAYYYFQTKKERNFFTNNIEIGDYLLLRGSLTLPNKNKTKGLFNYRKYLQRRKIYYLLEIDEVIRLRKNRNLLFKLKNYFYKKADNPYLKTFILGDTSLISKDTLNNYRELGISHLFAISGMHITLLSNLLLKLLKKFKLRENVCQVIVGVFLIIYLFCVGCSASILRAVLFYIFFSINKIFYFYIKQVQIFIIVLSISLLINPNYIFDIAFLYSFSISLSLLVMGKFINSFSNYFTKLLACSIISFIVSIPITLYYFNQLNILSPIYNLLYVPLVSLIIFPLALLTFIFKPLTFIFQKTINFLELSSVYFSKFEFPKLIFKSFPLPIYFLYVVLIIIILYFINLKKYKYLLILFLLLSFHYTYPKIFSKDYLTMLDIGQGDSFLLHLGNKNILIDTGGVMEYNKSSWKQVKNKSSIASSTTIPYLKRQGISKIDVLILTHGDEDHMGEAINLVNNFKVEKIIFNCGKFNYLEKELIKRLKKIKITYYNCIDELNIDNNIFYFLNTKVYDNENDNSNVIYVKIGKYKFLFMGDASINRENDILNEYELGNIDILKVGHHGSKTSSSKEFIDLIKPKYSLISVGVDNKYNHPNKGVLNTLKYSKIYRTDKMGTISFIIENNKLIIKNL